MNMIKSLFFSYIFQRSSGKNDFHASQKRVLMNMVFDFFRSRFSPAICLKISRYTDLLIENANLWIASPVTIHVQKVKEFGGWNTVECSEEYVHLLKPPFLMKVHELPDWKTNSAWTWQRLVSSLTLCCFDEGSWVCLLKIVDDCGTILFYLLQCAFSKKKWTCLLNILVNQSGKELLYSLKPIFEDQVNRPFCS